MVTEREQEPVPIIKRADNQDLDPLLVAHQDQMLPIDQLGVEAVTATETGVTMVVVIVADLTKHQRLLTASM